VEAIRFEKDKPVIVESLCTGCGICVKKCPFKAISIVNLPDELEKECSHRFGENTFKLYRLPTPSPGTVLGLLGQNGIGKTTTLKIFSNEIKITLETTRNGQAGKRLSAILGAQPFKSISKKWLKEN
jgi:ATP-binding cassette subfamily E protein 1